MERGRYNTRSSRNYGPRQQDHVARRPISVLGRSYNTWTVPLLRAFLSHYGQPQAHATSKTRLLQLMTRLARDYSLDGSDYEKMHAAYWARQEFPPCKPPLLAITRPPATIHAAGNFSAEVSGQAAPPRRTTMHSAVTSRTAASRPPAIIRPQATLRPASLASPTQHDHQKVSSGKEGESRSAASNPSLKSEKTCTICWDDLTPQTTPHEPITSACAHKANVCRSCVSISISSQLDSKLWDQITCPACDVKMNYISVQEFASATVLARYEQLALQAIVAASGGHLQQCRHAGCTSVQECFPDTDTYIICQQCFGRTCITCDVIFHAGISCTDRNARIEAGLSTDPNDLATERLLAGKVKNCPECGIRGIKIEGCDHMTCPRCNYEYCWLCFANYVEIRETGNEAHETSCRYHSSNLSPEHDYEDNEVDYDSSGCDDADDEDMDADETDRHVNPAPPVAGNRAEEAGPDTSLTPSENHAPNGGAFNGEVAPYAIRLPIIPRHRPRDADGSQDRERPNSHSTIIDEIEGSIVNIAAAMRDLRRRTIARIPQR